MSPTEKARKHTFVRVQIECGFDCFQIAGLAICTARGLRSRIAEITTVVFTAGGGWHFFFEK